MASNQPPSSVKAPLSFMQPLSPSVSYFKPSDASTNADAPELIVIFAWFAARDAHISKYTAQYRALFPSSAILVVRSTPRHVFLPRTRKTELLPAVSVLQAINDTGSGSSDRPRVLVHVFSNGGAASVGSMYGLVRAQRVRIPRHVTVLDSCPGYFHWRSTHRAIAQALPSWTSPLLYVALAVHWLIYRVLRKPLMPDLSAAQLNTKELVGLTPRRVYMYGTGDDMVDWRDVERHAAEARGLGFAVRLERFEGGKHVTHMRTDGDRYWTAVKEAWEGGCE